MTRYLALLCIAAMSAAGCCCSTQARRFVPASTLVRVAPQPTTRREFQAAEQQGYLIAATGHSPALDVWDQPVTMYEGEQLHVLGVDPESGDVLVCRRDDHRLIRLPSEDVKIETTTYRDLKP